MKNHSKSQKNHKIENRIVLDSKWVDLHNEHIIWYALVYYFCCSFRSMLFFIAVKKCTKAYHIIRSLCRSTHLESNTIKFSILWFFCDLLWFFKTILGGNLTGFEKFIGWYRLLFHKWQSLVYLKIRILKGSMWDQQNAGIAHKVQMQCFHISLQRSPAISTHIG